MEASATTNKASSLRWALLRRALLRRPASDPGKDPDHHNRILSRIEIADRSTPQGTVTRLCFTANLSMNSSNVKNCELHVTGHQRKFLLIIACYKQTCSDIQHNINANLAAFGGTKVKSMLLHWNQEAASDISDSFDVVVASDWSHNTFFKEFHKGLVQTVKFLLRKVGRSEAIFLSPRRGDSLDKFLVEVKESGLRYSIDEIYDSKVWRRHEDFINGNDSWPNYEKDHCYPLLILQAAVFISSFLVP
ncbi:hypothetical protein RJ639_042981 [Escallonia herrerae]|uniref:Uncharacterized protein n=1 Tax=Escallonia herrerae TaxID=1293975 RepID=A0AA89B0N0_9ASTE|nr:hypothetical protein RJ639_042981 [Escallonia herrerae]